MRPAALLLLAFAATSAHSAEPGRDIPYEDLTGRILPGVAADPAGVFRVSLCASPHDKDTALPGDLAIELRDGAHVQPLVLDAKHCFVPPLEATWTHPGTLLHINQPKGTVSLALNLDARVPAEKEVGYARLTESVPVMRQMIATQGMLARMVMPKMTAVILHYRPVSSETATVHAPGGDVRYSSDAKGDLRIPYDAALAAATVSLSALPQAIDPD
jgi:hypothetical protein